MFRFPGVRTSPPSLSTSNNSQFRSDAPSINDRLTTLESHPAIRPLALESLTTRLTKLENSRPRTSDYPAFFRLDGIESTVSSHSLRLLELKDALEKATNRLNKMERQASTGLSQGEKEDIDAILQLNQNPLASQIEENHVVYTRAIEALRAQDASLRKKMLEKSVQGEKTREEVMARLEKIEAKMGDGAQLNGGQIVREVGALLASAGMRGKIARDEVFSRLEKVETKMQDGAQVKGQIVKDLDALKAEVKLLREAPKMDAEATRAVEKLQYKLDTVKQLVRASDAARQAEPEKYLTRSQFQLQRSVDAARMEQLQKRFTALEVAFGQFRAESETRLRKVDLEKGAPVLKQNDTMEGCIRDSNPAGQGGEVMGFIPSPIQDPKVLLKEKEEQKALLVERWNLLKKKEQQLREVRKLEQEVKEKEETAGRYRAASAELEREIREWQECKAKGSKVQAFDFILIVPILFILYAVGITFFK